MGGPCAGIKIHGKGSGAEILLTRVVYSRTAAMSAKRGWKPWWRRSDGDCGTLAKIQYMRAFILSPAHFYQKI